MPQRTKIPVLVAFLAFTLASTGIAMTSGAAPIAVPDAQAGAKLRYVQTTKISGPFNHTDTENDVIEVLSRTPSSIRFALEGTAMSHPMQRREFTLETERLEISGDPPVTVAIAPFSLTSNLFGRIPPLLTPGQTWTVPLGQSILGPKGVLSVAVTRVDEAAREFKLDLHFKGESTTSFSTPNGLISGITTRDSSGQLTVRNGIISVFTMKGVDHEKLGSQEPDDAYFVMTRTLRK